MGIRHRLQGHLPVVDIEPGAQMAILGERPFPAALGERQHERQRRVVEREGRGARHGARHVGHAIMHDAVLDIGRLRMAGRARGFAAAALVDGDIDDDRARLHRGEHRAGDELRRRRARHQHRADQEVGPFDDLGDRRARRKNRPHAGAEMKGETPQRFGTAVDDGDIGAHAERDRRRMACRRRRRRG